MLLVATAEVMHVHNLAAAVRLQGGTDNGGNRLVTVLMYLSDVEEGGETVWSLASELESLHQHATHSALF